MTPSDPAFAQALQLYHAGRALEAEQACWALLNRHRDHAPAWKLLGDIHLRQGRLDEAIANYRNALHGHPHAVETHNNLGVALVQQGKHEEAAGAFQQALVCNPEHADAHNNLGRIFFDRGQPDAALPHFRQAVQLRSDHADAHFNLGKALFQQGNAADAAVAFREAVRLRPDDGNFQGNLGMALRQLEDWAGVVQCFTVVTEKRPTYADAFRILGDAYHKIGKPQEAKTTLMKALAIQPNLAEAHNSLGVVLLDEADYTGAADRFREALRCQPDRIEAQTNLGIAYFRLNDEEASVNALRTAVQMQPDRAATHGDLGNLLIDLGRPEEARISYEEAWRLAPEIPDVHKHLAGVCLLTGDWERGWRESEWRWDHPQKPLPFPQPRWQGEPLEGRSVLLYAEQGLGDAIQCIRYVPLVKARVAKVLVACAAAWQPLLRTCAAVDQWVDLGTPCPPFDCWCHLESLPAIFDTRVTNVPADVPYLHADPERVEYWRRQLELVPGLKVGIAWQGNPKYAKDGIRSVPLHHFAPLAQVPGVTLVSLQKGHGADQLATIADSFPVLDLGGRLDLEGYAFVDTAAVMMNLDLIITSDTSIPHLAGALGRPTWLALGAVAEWRWLRDRADSPWYPTLRLFRQAKRGDWEGLLTHLAAELAAWRVSQPPRLRAPISPGELVDKRTILQIKQERIADPVKLKHVVAELTVLEAASAAAWPASAELAECTAQLRAVNETLWDIEDRIRVCEREGDFGPAFVELARSVYQNNDRRAAIKRRINDLLGSSLVEEKQFVAESQNEETSTG